LGEEMRLFRSNIPYAEFEEFRRGGKPQVSDAEGAALRYFEEQGCREVFACVDGHDPSASNIFAAHGFTILFPDFHSRSSSKHIERIASPRLPLRFRVLLGGVKHELEVLG
jgi:hypothetical protein